MPGITARWTALGGTDGIGKHFVNIVFDKSIQLYQYLYIWDCGNKMQGVVLGIFCETFHLFKIQYISFLIGV